MTTATKFAAAPITKAVTDGSGRFTAILAAFGPPSDFQDEIFDKGAFTQSIVDWLARGVRVPIFWNHEADKPNSKIGDVITMREVDAGLLIEGQLNLKNPLAVEVYEALLTGSLDSMSIGYRYGDSYSADDGRHIATADVIEATFTPTPAEPRARVLSVKRRSATKAEVGSKILNELTDQFHKYDSFEPELWTKLARHIKSCVDDPRCDVQDLRDSVAAFIQSERDRVRWAREDRKLDDAIVRGKLDDLTASLFVKSPPWEIVERGDQFCVVKQEDGSTESCLDSRAAAERFMAALYANVPEDEKSLDEQLTVVARIGQYRIIRSGRGYVIVGHDTPVGRRRTLPEAQAFVEGLIRDDGLRAQVDALVHDGQGKSIGAKSATSNADRFIVADRAALAEDRVRIQEILATAGPQTRYAYETHREQYDNDPVSGLENIELLAAIERAGDVPPSEAQRDEAIARAIAREEAEHARRAQERLEDLERLERADEVNWTRNWVPAGAAAAYWETVGATPAPEAPMTYPEPRVHDAVPDDVGQTVRVPASMIQHEGVTVASDPALQQIPQPAGETVRLQVGGHVTPEIPVAPPAEDAFRIGTVPEEISQRTVEQERPIPSVDGVTDAEPIDVGLTVTPPRARRPKKEKK